VKTGLFVLALPLIKFFQAAEGAFDDPHHLERPFIVRNDCLDLYLETFAVWRSAPTACMALLRSEPLVRPLIIFSVWQIAIA
jgi:hypothetical protein